MEYDDFSCLLCNSVYDEKTHIPRMLISCGHTYCEVCLRNNYSNAEDNSLKCPEDNTQNHIKNVEDLPRNLTLIKLLKKSSNRNNTRTYTEQKRTSLGMLARASIPKFGGKIYLSSIDESNNASNFVNNPPEQFKDDLPQSDIVSRKSLNNLCNNYLNANHTYTSEFSLNESNAGGTNVFCNLHRRPLEIACLDHKVKICTTCALFGEHKHHNLKSEEDLIKDITLKAECLIELYELVEKNSEVFENNLVMYQRDVEEIKRNLTDENQKIKEKAKLYFKELRFLLKTKEKQIIDILDERLEDYLEKRFDYVKNIPKETRQKTAEWKKE